MTKKIVAYTDGSAVVAGTRKGNGGFGTYFPDLFGEKKAFSMGFKDAKTGQMEVMALLYAVEAMPLKHPEKVILQVYSDSEYVVKTFTENRLEKWISQGWTNSSGVVKNKVLWEKIVFGLEARSYLELELHHIRSHQVEKAKTDADKECLLKDKHIVGNMIADRLADYKRHNELF